MNEEKKIKERMDLHAAYACVFSSEEGKQVLEHLTKVSGISELRVGEKVEDMWINLGERRIVFSILRMLGKEPAYILKQAEHNYKKTYENT